MKKNIHSYDRRARFLFAALVAILYFSNIITGTFATVLLIAAIVLAATAVINFCPIYYMLGISTRRKSVQ